MIQQLKYFFIFFLTCFIFGLRAQNNYVDSLKEASKKTTSDTALCFILSELSDLSSESEWPAYNEQLKNIAEKNLKIYTQNHRLHSFFLKYLASSYNNTGLLFQQKGNIVKALEYNNKSLKIQEELGNKTGIAETLNNIGFIYNKQGDLDIALQFFFKSLKIQEDAKNKFGMSQTLNNIGLTYQDMNNFAKASEYFSRNLKLQEEIGDKNGVSLTLNNIGANYQQQGNLEKALEYYYKSLKIEEGSKNSDGLAISLVNVGYICFKKKDINKALEYGLKAMKISKELNYPSLIRNSAKLLSVTYKEKGDPKSALFNFELFIKMRDSISNQETRKASIKNQLKYEYEKKAAADSVKVAEEKKLTGIQLKQEEKQRYFLYFGLLLTLLFGIVMFNRFRITQKQKDIINGQKKIVEDQKNVVEVKQREILDSIHYAKRIQQSLLPTEKYIERVFKNKN